MLLWTLFQLKSRDPEVRKRAIRELADSGSKQSAKWLVPLLQDPVPGVQLRAIWALGLRGNLDTVASLMSVLDQSLLKDAAIKSIKQLVDSKEEVFKYCLSPLLEDANRMELSTDWFVRAIHDYADTINDPDILVALVCAESQLVGQKVMSEYLRLGELEKESTTLTWLNGSEGYVRENYISDEWYYFREGTAIDEEGQMFGSDPVFSGSSFSERSKILERIYTTEILNTSDKLVLHKKYWLAVTREFDWTQYKQQ